MTGILQILASSAGGGTPPVNTVAPTISGSTAVGSTLTSTTGTWTGNPTVSYTYQWLRAGATISGATSSTYVTVVADVGNAITCRVTGTNTAGGSSATSSNSITPVGVAPSNTVAPTVSGSTPVGSTLTSTTGTWTGTATITYTYQWLRAGATISGATSSTYVTVTADAGNAITCRVTGTNSYGNASATSSNSITPVGVAPSNTVAPTVSGSTPEGSTLTSTTGTWTGSATITYTYQWLRAGATISGATSSTYVTVAADIGSAITCRVTGTNSFGNASATSSNSITPTGVAPTNTIAPLVSGSTRAGSTLISTPGTWTGTATITFTYQWLRAGATISGATTSSYVTVAADIGNAITCRVTGTNSYGNANVTTSNSVTPVAGYIIASTSGATEVTSGNYKIATFTGSGSYTVTSLGIGQSEGDNVQVLVVAGGAGGGTSAYSGGGGAGGYQFNAAATVTATTYTVSVGAGGAINTNGSNTSITGLTSTGGGSGGSGSTTGASGGSGGGGGANTGSFAGGAGTSGQGNAGGAGDFGVNVGGGGGGAGSVGADGGAGGAGGSGTSNSISGSAVTYAVGGDGINITTGTAGTAQRGNGGGGNASGGSGILIVKWRFQ